MRTANLEKCLSIYKKNGRSRYVTLPEMRDFLEKRIQHEGHYQNEKNRGCQFVC